MFKKNIIKFLKFIYTIRIILKKYAFAPLDAAPRKKYVQKAWERFHEEQMNESYNFFSKFFLTAHFRTSDQIRDFAIKQAIEKFAEKNYYNLEFGVWTGASTRKFGKKLGNQKIYAFDSFQGLKDIWLGQNVSGEKFDLMGNIPVFEKNIVPIKGWVQDTLPTFIKDNFSENNNKIGFVHMDLDTYESSKFVLQQIKKHLAKNSIIIFDELYNYAGWQMGEFKALTEVFKENEYRYLCFSMDKEQVVIEIL